VEQQDQRSATAGLPDAITTALAAEIVSDSSPEEALIPAAWQETAQLPPAPGEREEDQSLPKEGELLTLDRLQQLAMSGNPTLRQAQGLLQQAQGNWLQVGLYPNPVVGYNGTGNNGPFDAQGAFLSQNIVTAKKLELNRAVASHDVQRAQWEAEAQRLRVANDIRIRYFAALGAQRQVDVAEDLVKVADQGVELSEQLLEGEQVSRADVLQARLQQNQTMLILRNAQFRAAATWKQLGNVIGWPDLPFLPLEGMLEETVPEVDWDVAWQQLLNENPLLQAARARTAAAVIQVRREEMQPIPDLQVMGNIWNDQIRPPSMMYGLNIGITLPVFDRNQGNVTAAVGELHAAQSEVTRLELTLRDRLAEAYQRYQAARNQVQIYRDSILPTAQENLSLTLKAYEEGELDFLRVLTARRDLFQANIDYVSALTELHIATIEIEGLQLTGGLEPVVSNPTPSNQSGQTNGPGN
jgi:cobalt-zinc-cadmium efflux system outer membrane protein